MSELGGRLRLKVGEGHTLLNFRQYQPPPPLIPYFTHQNCVVKRNDTR